jgi:YegS/Rv2252/BmrU family lipid kinase
LKKKVLFIVNPFSGTRSKERKAELIRTYVSGEVFDYEIAFTEAKGHAVDLAARAVKESFDYVVAVGGDGTMNESARSLINTQVALGIIPMGSGNGLARHLRIPLDTIAALRMLGKAEVVTIDSASLNGTPFFCTAGAGFDAYIGLKFEGKTKRGFQAYVQTTLGEFFSYKPDQYRLTIGGKTTVQTAFLVSFANAAQYGNDAFISPEASIRDGLIDVCVLKPFPPAIALNLGLKLFNRTLHQSKYLEIIRTPEATMERPVPGPVHLDGEPHWMEEKLQLQLLPRSLKILTAKESLVI